MKYSLGLTEREYLVRILKDRQVILDTLQYSATQNLRGDVRRKKVAQLEEEQSFVANLIHTLKEG